MHKTNIGLVSGILALCIAGVIALFPALQDLGPLRWLFLPALFATLLTSGSINSASAAALWVPFIFNTLLYWAVIFVIWAFFLERRIASDVYRQVEGVEVEKEVVRPTQQKKWFALNQE